MTKMKWSLIVVSVLCLLGFIIAQFVKWFNPISILLLGVLCVLFACVLINKIKENKTYFESDKFNYTTEQQKDRSKSYKGGRRDKILMVIALFALAVCCVWYAISYFL